MGIKKAFKVMLALEDINQATVARSINQTYQILNRKINNESMRYNEAEEIANHFGYDIVWVKRKD